MKIERAEDQAMRTMMIPMDAIVVAGRIRKDNGQLDNLAGSISERGLINPITVMENSDEKYTLIAGYRRMEACRMLDYHDIRATVLTPLAADEALMLEIDENEQRKEFTVSERLEYAEKIKAVEIEKAKLRKCRYGDVKRKELEVSVWSPQGDTGKVRDIVAKKAGFTSQQQMARAAIVAEKRPDLVEKIDRGETTIFGAYRETRRGENDSCSVEQGSGLNDGPFIPDEKLRGVPVMSDVKKRGRLTKEEREAVKRIEEQIVTARPIEVEVLELFNPAAVPVVGDENSIEGAPHDRLLDSPIYAELFEKYTEAVQIANATKGELRSRCENYEKRIRAYEENQQAMGRRIARLENECAALREDRHAGA